MVYSSTVAATSPTRAMKIFYKTVANPVSLLENMKTNIDELKLLDQVLTILQSDLEKSTGIFPESARRFQDWSVGLLSR